MNNRECGFSEEEMIDVILGNVSEERAHRFHHHLNECYFCRDLYSFWSELFNPETTFNQKPVKLRFRLQWEMAKRKWNTVPKFKYISSVVTAMICIVTVIGLFQLKNIVYPADFMASSSFNEQLSITENPQSLQYPIQTSTDHSHLKGSVWYNGHSKEVLVLLDGVDPAEKRDYQAWSVKGKHRANIGLLTLYEQKGYLYFQGEEMIWIEQLAVSLEPKGGSLVPTGPDAILVNIQR